jgi:hypothetical protein
MAERRYLRVPFAAIAFLGIALLIGACTRTQGPAKQDGGVPGSDGYTNFGAPLQGAGVAPAVNAFLWRASLDTISFMPLASADAYGGVVITDWYSPPESPNERFKVNVFVSGRQLRTDALRAVVFRQNKMADGSWTDAPVDAGTARSLEDTILARARQLRAEAPAQ